MATILVARRNSASSDALLVALALVHGGLLLAWPSIALIATGMWWNANTISHNFIHRPFFRSRALNEAFSWYLTLVLGFPQSLWRIRHLEHHSSRSEPQSEGQLTPSLIEFALLFLLWGAMMSFSPHFALTVYLPGYLIGLGLCALQGHYEHIRGPVSHYGWLYNLLLFNDGYHIEHHAFPGLHWRDLPAHRATRGSHSRYPAPLRWLECISLRTLECLVLRHPALQQLVIHQHERAIRSLLIELPTVRSAGIVGGGLFPRTAIILAHLIPDLTLTLIDLSAENLAIARPFLAAKVLEINTQFD